MKCPNCGADLVEGRCQYCGLAHSYKARMSDMKKYLREERDFPKRKVTFIILAAFGIYALIRGIVYGMQVDIVMFSCWSAMFLLFFNIYTKKPIYNVIHQYEKRVNTFVVMFFFFLSMGIDDVVDGEFSDSGMGFVGAALFLGFAIYYNRKGNREIDD